MEPGWRLRHPTTWRFLRVAVVGVLCATASWLAIASPASARDIPVPVSMVIPAPQVGDKGFYSYELTHTPLLGKPEILLSGYFAAAFVRMPDSVALAANGTWVPVSVLGAHWNPQTLEGGVPRHFKESTRDPWQISLYPNTERHAADEAGGLVQVSWGEAPSSGSWISRQSNATRTMAWNVTDAGQQLRGSMHDSPTDHFMQPEPCGLRSPQIIRADKGWLLPRCAVDSQVVSNLTLMPDQATQQGARLCISMRAPPGEHRLSMWFCNDSAYARTVEVEHSHYEGLASRYVLHPETPARPPYETVPAPPVGSKVPMPFPAPDATPRVPDDLRRATTAAMSDANATTWMQTHPQAWLAEAASHIDSVQGRTTTTWALTWVAAKADGRLSFWNATVIFGLDGLVKAQAGAILRGADWEQPAATRPPQGPWLNLSSMQAAFEAWGQQIGLPSKKATDWGFVARPDPRCADCLAILHEWTGRDIESAWSNGSAAPTHTVRSLSRLWFGPDGNIEQYKINEDDQTATPCDCKAPTGLQTLTASSGTSRPLNLPPLPAKLWWSGSIGLLGVIVAWIATGGRWGLALFSRVRENDLMRHPLRASMMQTIEGAPGIRYQDLCNVLGLSHSQLEHHVRKLMDAGLVVAVGGNGLTCFFPKGVDRRVMALVPFLAAPTARMMAYGLEAGMQEPADLAPLVGVDETTVRYHLRRLRSRGALTGRQQGIRLTDHAAAALRLAQAAASMTAL